MIDVTGLLVFIVVVAMFGVLADLEPKRHGPRYSGKVYDPQPRPFRRSGAIPYVGVLCPLCGTTTYGNNRCRSCGRLNVRGKIVQ